MEDATDIYGLCRADLGVVILHLALYVHHAHFIRRTTPLVRQNYLLK